MPLVLREEAGTGRLFGVWRAGEPEEWFLNYLPLHPAEAEELKRIRNPKKRVQWLAARAAFRLAVPELSGLPVLKNERKAPYLPDSDASLSFSHSGVYAAFAINASGIAAVDLEAARSNQQTGAARMFMAPEEQEALRACQDVNYFLSVWCAKECMFKAVNHGHREISFQREFKTTLNPAALAQPRGAFSGSFEREGEEQQFDLEFFKTKEWLACLLLK